MVARSDRLQTFARVAAMALAALPMSALAAPRQVTAAGRASAQVVAPLVVERQADLAFGAVFASQAAGTVTVAPDGRLTTSGGARPACFSATCPGAHPAAFAVQGEPGRAYTIRLPGMVTASGTARDSGGPPPPLQVDALSATSLGAPSRPNAGQLDARGRDAFRIGGTLHLPAGLPGADYRATVAVMVVYG